MEYNNGSTGVNNYNEKFLIRVYKNGHLVYSQNNLPTARTWNEESFDFTDHVEFTVEEESIFNFELYGYCVVESGGTPGWEIDDIKIFGGECSGSSVASNVTYLWSTGATTSNINVNPTAITTYTVAVTNSCNGCKGTDDFTLTVHPLPTANIAGDNEICLGGHTTLTATGGTFYVWSNGETTNWITVSPSATKEYSVTVTDGNGCQATAAYTVTVHPLPTANIARQRNLLGWTYTTLTATGGTSYLWSNGETTTNNTVSPSATTEYSVTVTDGNGCQATSAYTVTVHPLPTANIAGDNEICLGGHTTLTATGGTSYLWSNGETTNWITVSPSATTEYSVTVTDGNGCQATVSSHTVTVHSLPTANIAGDNEICLGDI
ncbi:MAG: hypothetical protein U0T36_00130 [Saprospiraceae bacterium]